MGKGIVFVGKADEIRARWGDAALVWSVSELASRFAEGLRLVVISPAAARDLDPRQLRARLAQLAGRIVVTFDSGDDRLAVAMLRWLQEGVRVEPPRIVAQLVADARATISRPEIEVTAWLPRVPHRGTILARLAEVVPTLDPLSVKNLGDALGCTEDGASRICMRAFGCNAKQLLQSYLLAAAARVPDHVSPHQRARLFGYADISSLTRALRLARGAVERRPQQPDSV